VPEQQCEICDGQDDVHVVEGFVATAYYRQGEHAEEKQVDQRRETSSVVGYQLKTLTERIEPYLSQPT